MMKKIASVAIALLFLISATKSTSASLVTVDKEGKIILNVLSIETPLTAPTASELAIKDIKTETGETPDSQVSLSKDNDKIALNILSEDGEKNLDVTGLGGDLVEIEERPEVKSLKIGVKDGQFAIEQENFIALTSFPIKIAPKEAKISLTTPSGERFLTIFPKEAFASGLKAKVISKLKAGTNPVIVEAGNRELQYQIEGEKTINLFNLTTVDVPVKASISALTGEIVGLEQPTWLKIFGFIFS